MASYTKRTTTVTRHEWVIPAPNERGAAFGEFRSAFEAARSAYQTAHNLGEYVIDLPDNALWIKCEDDQVVLYFDVEKES